jgi:cytochrome oxidase Cu insertion factor (SCO1/SenC/PrrC family)
MNHSPAPSPEDRRQRRKLLGLAALFFMPLVIAFGLYYGGYAPSGRVNHGDLIDPARPLPAVTLPTLAGGTTDARFLREQWSLVYVTGDTCDAACQLALENAHQVRLALRENTPRVRRVLLYTSPCCDPALDLAGASDLASGEVSSAEGQALLALFPAPNQVPVQRAGRLYLVDPLGNLMMSYPAGFDRKALLEDLKKLLKLSHIG